MRAAIAVATAVASMVAAPLGASADGPVDDSRHAVEQLRFSGDVRVQWVDEDGVHTQELAVEGGNGVIVVRGPTSLMARQRERYVNEAGAGWSLVWPAQLAPEGPGIEEKYDVTYEPGPVVAGRRTHAALVRLDGTLRERFYIDDSTGLILRREQLDPAGGVRRLVAFDRMTTSSSPTPTKPRVVADHSPQLVGLRGPSRPYRAPSDLAGGYRRVGAYRRQALLQVLYSDGVYGLSVFEQRGSLDRGKLPHNARKVRVGNTSGWHMAWPGGDVVVWQAGDAVFTVVGEAPFTDIVAAARSMPRAAEPSAVDKLRRVCRSFLQLID